jgi:hypothetical protein
MMTTLTYPQREITSRIHHVHDYHPIFFHDGRVVFMCDCDNVLSMDQVLAIINKAA